jgi:hypothetical protein
MAGRRRVPQFIFLHGYTTPYPAAKIWDALFAQSGRSEVQVHTPVAPNGRSRRDPFNPKGRPSWFRYSTDHSALVPQRADRPDLGDVAHGMYDSGGTKAGPPLWDLLSSAVRAAGGAADVALAGESQGGVMAAFLGFEWNRRHPDDQLGALGLIRTAVDPQTWQPRPPSRQNLSFDDAWAGVGVVDDPEWTGVPPRYRTMFHVVLGADDVTFRTYLSMYSLGPLLQRNPLRDGTDGNVEITVLPGVGHADHDRQVYRTYLKSLLQTWPAPGREVA